MMNVLALGLVLTSLLTAAFFSPSPEKPAADDVIVKDGHRVVVVEFEKDDGGHTKVLISPPDPEKRRAAVYPNGKSEITGKLKNTESTRSEEKQGEEEATPRPFTPRELVCDAYGKCKHKIASAFEKAKDTVADKDHELQDDVKDAMSSAVDQIKDTVSRTEDEISEKAHQMKEGANKVKEEVEEEAREMAERAKEGVITAKREGEKELGEIMHGVREVGSDVFKYVFSPGKLGPLFGILHLMGFAAAYGMCVWVTFASSYVLAGTLSRGQFALVQSRIYPVYFRAMAYSVVLAILGHVLMGRAGLFQGFNLMAALVMVMVNMLYLEPQAAKVLFQRMKKEKEEGNQATTEPSGKRATNSTAETAGRGNMPTAESLGLKEKQQQQQQQEEEIAAKAEVVRLNEKLQRLNSYSSFLNVLTLMSLTWHLVHLGQRLHLACK